MREEFVTKSIMAFLKRKGYEIVSFDFPQSGTGFALHPDKRTGKNEDIVIADILARKGNTGCIMENKDRYDKGDFTKLNNLRDGNRYTQTLGGLKQRLRISNLVYGVGIPREERALSKALKASSMVDFIIAVERTGECLAPYGADKIP